MVIKNRRGFPRTVEKISQINKMASLKDSGLSYAVIGRNYGSLNF